MTGFTRRILIVDRKWQFHIWRLVAGASIFTGILYLMAGFALITLLPLEELSAEHLGLIAFGVNALFFVAMALVMWVVTMRFTHAVAGPARVLKTAIEGLAKGEYHHRATLREHDYLQDLAAAVQTLQKQLREAAGQKLATGELALPAAQGPSSPVVGEPLSTIEDVASPLAQTDPVGLPAAGKSQRGFTLMETMVAALILVLGVQGVLLTAGRCSQLQQATSDHLRAQNACRDFMERFRNGDLVTQFQTYAGHAPFQVGDQTVTVTFPESVLTQAIGTVPTTARFRDLTGSGQVCLNTASTDVAGLLPVQITVRRGSFRMQVSCLVTDR